MLRIIELFITLPSTADTITQAAAERSRTIDPDAPDPAAPKLPPETAGLPEESKRQLEDAMAGHIVGTATMTSDTRFIRLPS